MTPPALERVVKTCLVKDPDERWQSAHDIAAELRWIAEGGEQQGAAAVSAVPFIRKWIWLTAGVVLGAVLAVLPFLMKNVPAQQTAHLSLLPPPGVKSVFAIALSPDGKKVAFTTPVAGGSLWVRSLDTDSVQQLQPGIEEAYPFWSPDGKFIAYESENQLLKISATGGPAQVLCSARYPSGGTWNKDGVIVFGSFQTPLYKVPSTGGNPVQLDAFDASHHETGHLWPSFLPDGRHYLYLGIATLAADYTLRIGSLDSKDGIILFDHIFSPAIYDSGRILFVRDGNLMAQPFDAVRLKLTGEAIPVAAHIAWHDRYYYPFSANGAMLVFLQHDPTGRLKWFDRTGKMLGEVGSPADDVGAELSPDDQTVAFERLDVNRRNPDIWLLDLQRGAESQFTINPMGDVFPVWSPDGKTIAYESLVDGKVGIYRAPAIGGARELIVQSEGDLQSWEEPGISLEVNNETLGSADIAVLLLSGDHKLIPIAETVAWEWRGQFSLDGHWIAYNSGSEVFVQPFPPTGARWQVSSNGGGEVRWRADGRELYFIGNDRQLMAVEVQTENGFHAGIPKPLFTADFRDFQNRFSYDVTRDGQRFLVNTEEPETAVLSVIVNWFDSL